MKFNKGKMNIFFCNNKYWVSSVMSDIQDLIKKHINVTVVRLKSEMYFTNIFFYKYHTYSIIIWFMNE
jgi:hypothetical protein